MATTHIVELNDGNFESEVLKSDVPVLVDFTATWCAPCKALAPIVENLATETTGKYKVAKLDIDAATDTARKFRVMSVPTVMVFKGGQLKGQHVGLTSKENLVRMLEKA